MTRQHSNRAFSLVELIIAILILGIGMISIAALFPAGIKQQEIAEDDVYGPLVARHAMELLRTRLKQEDFGCFEDFSDAASLTSKVDLIPLGNTAASSASPFTPTIAKDWIWKRPGFITVDDTNTSDRDEAGMYDIFSYYGTRRNVGGSRTTSPNTLPTNFTSTTMLTDVNFPTGFASQQNKIFGIPYNREKFDEQMNVSKVNYTWTFADSGIPSTGIAPSDTSTGNALREPAVFITQRERYWPMPTNAIGLTPTPKYVWDCMFRKFNSRILVGVFVYRVVPANGLRGGNYAPIDSNNPTGPQIGTPYVSAQVTEKLDPDFFKFTSKYPPIPQWVSTRDDSPKNLFAGAVARKKWGSGGLDSKVGSTISSYLYSPYRDDCGVPGTDPETDDSAESVLKFHETWQQPGQWFIDQYNNVHHVIEGRRMHTDGPVILAKPVPRQPYSNALFDAKNKQERKNNTDVNNLPVPPAPDTALLATPGSGGDAVLGIQDLWFVPPYDANGNQIIPVFACVEEL